MTPPSTLPFGGVNKLTIYNIDTVPTAAETDEQFDVAIGSPVTPSTLASESDPSTRDSFVRVLQVSTGTPAQAAVAGPPEMSALETRNTQQEGAVPATNRRNAKRCVLRVCHSIMFIY